MKVIDARSGQEMKVGEAVHYPEGEWLRLDAVVPGIFSAKAVITSADRHYQTGKLVARQQTVPLRVRWLHPGFPFQHVAFIPS
jgi:hypothetical protein